MSSDSDVAANVVAWTRRNAEHTDAAAARAWVREEITWGMARVPESELGVLGDVAELDVVELGCGTAYFSAWLAKRHARVVGVDPTPAQLDTARRLMREIGPEFQLVEWDDGSDGVEYQLTHGDWIAVLRNAGFEIERLVELQAAADAEAHEYYVDMTPDWAHRWPGEEIWVARKR